MAPGFVGLLQANVLVPPLAPGDYPIAVTIGGNISNSALVTVGRH